MSERFHAWADEAFIDLNLRGNSDGLGIPSSMTLSISGRHEQKSVIFSHGIDNLSVSRRQDFESLESARPRVTGRKPKVFNTDQGSQFTSPEWIQTIEGNGIKVSMDGKGRWMDNVFIERLWRSIKYEKLRLWSYETVGEVTQLVSDWMEFYNHRRNHSALGGRSPWAVYEPEITLKTAA